MIITSRGLVSRFNLLSQPVTRPCWAMVDSEDGTLFLGAEKKTTDNSNVLSLHEVTFSGPFEGKHEALKMEALIKKHEERAPKGDRVGNHRS